MASFLAAMFQFSFQYVRVMAEGAQCAEDGPFFLTTPQSMNLNGISINKNIFIMSDWVLIGAMIASFFLLLLILVVGLVSRSHSLSVVRRVEAILWSRSCTCDASRGQSILQRMGRSGYNETPLGF